MLKKVAYVVITSGLFLAPLGASAMVTDSPFPACVGSDCATAQHDVRDSLAARSETAKEASGRKNWVTGQDRTSDSPYPADNSKD